MMWKHRSNSQGALGSATLLTLLVAISFGCLVQASHDQEEQGDSEGKNQTTLGIVYNSTIHYQK